MHTYNPPLLLQKPEIRTDRRDLSSRDGDDGKGGTDCFQNVICKSESTCVLLTHDLVLLVLEKNSFQKELL